MEWEEMYDLLADVVGVSKEALDLAFAVGGCNEETAERILFYFTGWRTFEGWLGQFDDDEDENDLSDMEELFNTFDYSSQTT